MHMVPINATKLSHVVHALDFLLKNLIISMVAVAFNIMSSVDTLFQLYVHISIMYHFHVVFFSH